MTKSFTGYYGGNESSNTQFFKTQYQTKGLTTTTQPHDPTVSSYEDSVFADSKNYTSTGAHGTTTYTEQTRFSAPVDVKTLHHNSHSQIVEKLKKKKHPASHYTVYRFEVLSASNLRSKDMNNSADPYVKCLKAKVKSIRKQDDAKLKELFKTHTVSKSLCPTFNHTEIVILNNNDQYIDFEVWDKDLFSSDYIGGVRVDLSLQNEYIVVAQLLTLTNEHGKNVGEITIRVSKEKYDDSGLKY